MTPLYCVLRTDWLAPPTSQWENLLTALHHLKLADAVIGRDADYHQFGQDSGTRSIMLVTTNSVRTSGPQHCAI